jgi:serine/threonine protein kinase
MDKPRVGTEIGQYVLEGKLGEGGMAEVWRARNSVLGHSVAIKFLALQFAGNTEVEHRFLQEGKRQANLQHPNIVSAFDFLYCEDRSFLVMKFIRERAWTIGSSSCTLRWRFLPSCQYRGMFWERSTMRTRRAWFIGTSSHPTFRSILRNGRMCWISALRLRSVNNG